MPRTVVTARKLGSRVAWLGRWFVPRALPAVLAALLLAATPAWASVTPANGTRKWNRPVCGSGYVPVDLGHGNYFNVINAPAHNTCVTVERGHLSWYVSSWHQAAHEWEYPNISSGIEWGRYTCNDGANGYPSNPGSKCMRYPVRVDRDGAPVTSASVHPHILNGNVSYDIWLNRKNVSPSRLGQPNGAEVMIWLTYPGIADEADDRHVVIDGIAWDVMTWEARNREDGHVVAVYRLPGAPAAGQRVPALAEPVLPGRGGGGGDIAVLVSHRHRLRGGDQQDGSGGRVRRRAILPHWGEVTPSRPRVRPTLSRIAIWKRSGSPIPAAAAIIEITLFRAKEQ